MCRARLFSQGRPLCTRFLSGQGSPPSAIVGIRKPQALSYPDRLHTSAFPRFDTIPECDRQTDGQTDEYAAHSVYNAVCCNKNYKQIEQSKFLQKQEQHTQHSNVTKLRQNYNDKLLVVNFPEI